jgi:hypothetical protein
MRTGGSFDLAMFWKKLKLEVSLIFPKKKKKKKKTPLT